MFRAADWSIKNNVAKEAIIVVDDLKHIKSIRTTTCSTITANELFNHWQLYNNIL